MGKCSVCGKKLGVLEGYETFDKEYCEKCFIKKQEAKSEEQNQKEIENNQKKIEKEKRIEEERKKTWVGRNLSKQEAWWLWIILFLVIMASLKILGLSS